MSLRSNIILALIVGIVAALIFKVEIPREEEAKLSEQWFPRVKKNNISRIEVTAGPKKFSLKNEAPTPVKPDEVVDAIDDSLGTWKFENVTWQEVDQGTVTSLLQALLSLRKESEIPEAERDSDLSRYGLQPPTAQIMVQVGEGAKTILLGKFNSYVSKRYVKEELNPSIYLVSESLSGVVEREVNEFRNRKIIDFNDDDVSELSLVVGNKTLRLAPGEKDWKLLSPFEATASKIEVTKIFTALKELRANSFPEVPVNPKDSEDPMVVSLEKPDVIATLTLAERTKRDPIVVRAKKIKGELYKDDAKKPVRGPDRVVVVKDGVAARFVTADNPLARLMPSPEELRERQLFRIDTVKASKVVFGGDEIEPLIIEKKGDSWMFGDKPADSTFVNQLLSDISLVRAESFPSSSKGSKLDTPRMIVTVSSPRPGKEGSEAESARVLRIGSETSYVVPSEKGGENKKQPKKEKGYFAEVDGNGEIFVISAASYKKIMPRMEALLPASEESASDGNSAEE